MFVDSIAKHACYEVYNKLTSVEDIRLSEHFTLFEFLRSAKASSLNIQNCPSSEEEWLKVVTNLTYLIHYVLEPLRQYFAVPVNITSGFRTPTVNEAVGGVVDSYHLFGRAADIRVDLMSPSVICDWLHARRIKYIKYPTFIHVQI